MTTTYLLPCYQEGDCWIESVNAKSLKDAEDKFIDKFYNEYDFDLADDWNNFIKLLGDADIVIGTIQDIDEF